MANGSNDRLARIEALIDRSTTASNERMDRLEQVMERNYQASNARMDRLEAAIETFREPIEVLLEAATRHEAMISRLDAILERMIYREGRGNNDQ